MKVWKLLPAVAAPLLSQPTTVTLYLVPGLRPSSAAVASLLLSLISGQEGQPASFTVHAYCAGKRTNKLRSYAKQVDAGWAAGWAWARRRPTRTKGQEPGEGVAVAVPAVGLVAAADSTRSVAGVVSWELPGSWISVELDSTHTTVTLYVVPGCSPPATHRGAAHGTMLHGAFGGRVGHRRSL